MALAELRRRSLGGQAYLTAIKVSFLSELQGKAWAWCGVAQQQQANKVVMGAAVGVIYVYHVTPPVPTPFAVFEGVAGSYTPRGKIAQLS